MGVKWEMGIFFIRADISLSLLMGYYSYSVFPLFYTLVREEGRTRTAVTRRLRGEQMAIGGWTEKRDKEEELEDMREREGRTKGDRGRAMERKGKGR